MAYATLYNPNKTHQTQKASPNQVKNSAGGYSFKISDFESADRFMILGSASNTFYANKKELTKENAEVIIKLLKNPESAKKLISRATQISVEFLAAKPEPVIYTFALAMAIGCDEAKEAVKQNIASVLRTGTHLFTFIDYVKEMRGWGRSLKRLIAANFFENVDVNTLAYRSIKYRQRNGISVRDVLRLSHPRIPLNDLEKRALIQYLVNPNSYHDTGEISVANWKTELGVDDTGRRTHIKSSVDTPKLVELPQIVKGFELIKNTKSATIAAQLIREYNLPREAVPTDLLNSLEVWDALLDKMPMIALVRNLATMTRVGLIKPLGKRNSDVLAKFSPENIQKSGIHPIQMLSALRTYESGHGVRGQNSWNPVSQITEALDKGFYTAFKNVQPTGKRIFLALDVSGSMTWGEIANVPGLTPRDASAALAMVTMAVEDNTFIAGFTDGGYSGVDMSPLKINSRQSLNEVVRYVNSLSFGGTDCSLPMQYALGNNIEVDAFVVYTDNETYAGKIHPHQALAEYNRKMNLDAKVIVVGMTANGFTIANPDDKKMLDVVGFSADTPQVISNFIRG